MATTTERLGIVETKVENLNEKLDHLKVDVKDMHDCLDKTRDELKADLDKMYGASCDQHAALAKDLSELKKLKDKWTYMIAGGIGVGGWIAGHSDKILSLLS
jgi:hypothetical protein